MATKKSQTGDALPAKIVFAKDVYRPLGDCGRNVRVDLIISSSQVHPTTPGPWANEADKTAWIDGQTGYGCIIRRAAHGGHLCGYVGVGPEHPVFGFAAAVLRSLGVRAHGGISYARECERHEDERTTTTAVWRPDMDICHQVATHRTNQHTTKQRRTVVEVKPHDDLWWIGFECNQPTDVLPGIDEPGAQTVHLPDCPAGTCARVYRDEAYVFDHVLWLTEQLRALELGRDPTDTAERWMPACGFDTRGGSA